MSATRPIPTVIGATENALRALLTAALTPTRIGSYEQWVVVNMASSGDAAWRETAADALKIGPDAVTQITDELRTTGLMDRNDAPTAAGLTALATARSAVAATTAQLVLGISEEAQDTTRQVLDHIRTSAEELLRHDAQAGNNNAAMSFARRQTRREQSSR